MESRGAGAILELVRGQTAITRAELVLRSGLSRSTVTQRLDQLLAHGLVTDAEGASTGGRRPSLFAFNPRGGVVLAAGLGATHARLAVTDLSGATLAHRADDIDIAAGPEVVLSWVEAQFAELLA
jgi:DNA-binding transcriptional ArsR family regulator